jgi:AcrR family transcriptional regulator
LTTSTSAHTNGDRPEGLHVEPDALLARITDAARASFAFNGWAGTSSRGIAREVGIDPALIHERFASKEDLLDAATTPPQEWIASIHAAGTGPLETRGETILRTLLWSWSQPAIRDVLGSVVLTASHEPITREKLRGFLTATLLPALAEHIDDDERLLRASLIGSHLIGLTMMRWVWRIEPLASLGEDDVVAMLAPTLQRLLSDPLG